MKNKSLTIISTTIFILMVTIGAYLGFQMNFPLEFLGNYMSLEEAIGLEAFVILAIWFSLMYIFSHYNLYKSIKYLISLSLPSGFGLIIGLSAFYIYQCYLGYYYHWGYTLEMFIAIIAFHIWANFHIKEMIKDIEKIFN